MWAHYSDGHRGACLKFVAKGGVFETTQPVQYAEAATWKAPPIGCSEDEAVMAAILTKEACWKYEEEYRLITPNEAGYKVAFQAQELAGIIFGSAMPAETRRMIAAWNVQRGSEVPLFETRRVPNTLMMEILALS